MGIETGQGWDENAEFADQGEEAWPKHWRIQTYAGEWGVVEKEREASFA